jgi:hypothetical protein
MECVRSQEHESHSICTPGSLIAWKIKSELDVEHFEVELTKNLVRLVLTFPMGDCHCVKDEQINNALPFNVQSLNCLQSCQPARLLHLQPKPTHESIKTSRQSTTL